MVVETEPPTCFRRLTKQVGRSSSVTHGMGETNPAAQLARSQQADAAQAAALSTDRWPGIVAAITRHVEAYNTGARRVVLNVVEESGESTVNVAAGSEGAPYLTVTLEGIFICMKARDALGIPHATEFRLCSDRDDDATAAYLLQNWMERL